ncbi:MAG: hypothetical protein HYR71_01545 [Chloroflexi bacterium]|nr:hypothetical protein [Chloroflexota bacterium]
MRAGPYRALIVLSTAVLTAMGLGLCLLQTAPAEARSPTAPAVSGDPSLSATQPYTLFLPVVMQPIGNTGPQGLQAGQPIGDNGEIFFTDTVASQIASAGAGWVRINFRLGAHFPDWTTPVSATTALSLYDSIVTTALNHNLKVLGLLSNESWVGGLSDWQANNAEVAGGNGDNTFIQQFDTYAARVLMPHFAGKITEWEVWNEPNAGPTYVYPSNFAWLLRRAYLAARDNGITATLISGGLFSSNPYGSTLLTSANTGADYLTSTYTQGKLNAGWDGLKSTYGSYPLDTIGQHIYIDWWAGLTTAARVEQTASFVFNAYAAFEGVTTTKRINITEMGWGTDWVSESTQATSLSTAYIKLKQLTYIERTYWFFLQDIPVASLYYGLLREDGSAKPAWSSYQQIH